MIMRKRQINNILCGALLGIFCSTSICFAQEPEEKSEEAKRKEDLYKREMTLEREYDPIVQDAVKVSTIPEVRAINVSKRAIVYSDYAIPVATPKDMIVLPSGSFTTKIEHGQRDGYLHFGGGMLLNMQGDVGYHLLNNDSDKLAVWFSHRSTNGNVKFFDPDSLTRKAKINDNIGGLDFKHHFSGSILSLGGKYSYSAFNYYGKDMNISASSDTTIYTTNQVNQLINVYAGLASTNLLSLGYNFGVDFTHFGQQYSLSPAPYFKGIKENHVKINFGIRSPVNDGKSFGLNLNSNMLSYTEPMQSAVPIDSMAFDTHINATMNPYFNIYRETWNLLLGFNMVLVAQNGTTDVFLTPNIKLDIPFANSRSLFYAYLTGQVESNSMAEISRVNRYFNPLFTADASKTFANLQLGVRSSVATGLWFDIFASYKYTENILLFNPSQLDFGSDVGFRNFSMPFQPLAQFIQPGASLKYDYRKIFEIYARGVSNFYQLKCLESWKNQEVYTNVSKTDECKAYGMPTVELSAGINVRPITPLTISLDYTLLSGMYASIGKGKERKDVQMQDVNDLRLRALWQFDDRYSVYLQLNNLMFQRHELYYGYPLQPFSAMVGFNVNF